MAKTRKNGIRSRASFGSVKSLFYECDRRAKLCLYISLRDLRANSPVKAIIAEVTKDEISK